MLSLVKIVFADLEYDFEKAYISKILLFHQTINTEHPAFQAIMEGGGMFTKFINGNTTIPLTAIMTIERLIEDPRFPPFVEAL